MNRSVVSALILKDLYLFRWMVAASILGGAAALAVMPTGRISGYVGGVSFICVLVILNIFLVMTGVVGERKDKVLLFVLSLPVSTTQYTIAFTVTWLVLTIAAALVIVRSPIPDGLLPFWLAVLAYLLFYYCALLAVALVSDSTGWHATAITAGNVSINFVIPFLLSLPSVAQHSESPVPVWTADVVAILAIEIAAGVAALVLAIYIRSRRSDFI
jgi:ABC-2 type transport system permease protein